MRIERFTLTEQHVALLRRAYVEWQDCETGAPEIDPKRPYGSSGVGRDVAEILGVKLPDGDEDEEGYDRVIGQMLAIHYQTDKALQVILSSGSFEPGTYEIDRDEYNRRAWRRVATP